MRLSFHCSACGKCCDSPPQMSLPELFRHQDTFIGSLALRQVARPHAGARIGDGAEIHLVDTAQAAAFDVLADELLWWSADGQRCVALHAQAIDYASRAQCPALREDGRCGVHAAGKPAMCEVVPLDPWAPDLLQGVVLSRSARRAPFADAGCIADTATGTHALLFADRRITDTAHADAMVRLRTALASERRHWGDEVAAQLGPHLMSAAPRTGIRTLSLVPALRIIGDASSASRARCIDYIRAQRTLIARQIDLAVARRQSRDRAMTEELRGHARAYGELLAHWAASAPPRDTAPVDAYLGV
ncbi:MAG: hypothetical protein QM639_18630 [Rhodocyclaceae bacterium]